MIELNSIGLLSELQIQCAAAVACPDSVGASHNSSFGVLCTACKGLHSVQTHYTKSILLLHIPGIIM